AAAAAARRPAASRPVARQSAGEQPPLHRPWRPAAAGGRTAGPAGDNKPAGLCSGGAGRTAAQAVRALLSSGTFPQPRTRWRWPGPGALPQHRGSAWRQHRSATVSARGIAGVGAAAFALRGDGSMAESGTRVLIVEDEPKLASLLADYLRAAGYDCEILGNGAEVVPAVRANPPDLILLDLMLPGKDGLDVCRELRSFSDVPIIMVTARVEEIDRLLGLELGADDYVCKPFSPREVVARVKAILRRVERSGEPAAVTGLIIDEDGYRAS